MSEDEMDVIIEIPALEGMAVHPGLPIELLDLETDFPKMKIGTVSFIGQYQHIIGTAVIVENASAAGSIAAHTSAATAAAKQASSSMSSTSSTTNTSVLQPPSNLHIETLARRKIVFQVAGGNLQSVATKGMMK